MDDDGFTLIEVLIAMFIMSIVFTVVSVAFIVAQQSTNESTTRLLESQDGALTSAYFGRDAESAPSVAVAPLCGTATGTPVVSMTWTETLASGNTTYNVDYRYSGGSLTRYTCGPTTGSMVLASSLRAAPTVACTPSCGSPTTVRLTLTDTVDGSFAITAARRTT
jgi:prepilin-type N-terminal cleavage/methylation domain-containing protein